MSCGQCCNDFQIKPMDLLFPERMSPEGREFVAAHGVYIRSLEDLRTLLRDAPELPDTNGKVYVQHRCQHLDADNLCDIYDLRPQICRDYDCSTRPDRTCGIPENVPVPITFRRSGAVN